MAASVSAQLLEDQTIEGVEAALQAVTGVLSLGRVQDRILREARVDISRADSALLYNLYNSGDHVRLRDLAGRLGVDAPTVTRRVQQLEARRLLRRTADLVDKRALRVQLTSDGTRAIEKVLKARRTWLERVLRSWTAEDRVQLERVMGLFAAAITADLESPHGH